MLKQDDVVALVDWAPVHGLAAGAVGVVAEVWEETGLVLVEFCDDAGEVTAAAVGAGEVERVDWGRMENDRLLKPKEVAALFRVDPKTVTRWALAGRIETLRTPGGHRRFRESVVRRMLDAAATERAPEL